MRKLSPGWWLALLLVLVSCVPRSPREQSAEGSFPLKEAESIPANGTIEEIAVSDTWTAIYTADKITAVDIATRKTLWTVTFPVFTDFQSEFRIVGDTLIAASLNQVIMVERSGRQRLLALERHQGNILRIVAVYPGYIYLIRGPDWQLEAYDLLGNALLWSALTGRGGTDVFLDETANVVYVASRDYGFRAFDNVTGRLLWSAERSSVTGAFDSGLVYSAVPGSRDTYDLSAYDVRDKNEVWTATATNSSEIYALTIIGRLLVASASSGLLAFDKESGELLWRADLGDAIRSRPVTFNGVLYVRGQSHTVYAVSVGDGNVTGLLRLEQAGPIQPLYAARAGIFTTQHGLAFATTTALVIYGVK